TLTADSRLDPVPASRWRLYRGILSPLFRTRIVTLTIGALLSPKRARRKIDRLFSRELKNRKSELLSPEQHLSEVERLLKDSCSVLPITGFPEAIAGYLSLGTAQRLLGDSVTEE